MAAEECTLRFTISASHLAASGIPLPKIPKRPQIARGTGHWQRSKWGRIWNRAIDEDVYEAFFAFPAGIATMAELEALDTKPQEDW